MQAQQLAPMVTKADIERTLRSADPDTIIEVWVVPGAKRSEIVGVHDNALRVRIASPAEGGKANYALLKLIRNVVSAAAELEHGATSRRKRVLVAKSRDSVAATISEHLLGKR